MKKRIDYKTVRKGAGGCGGNWIQFPALAEVKRQFAKYLAISPDQLDEQHQEEAPPSPVLAPAPLVAGDPGALLDIICKLWQARAGGPIPDLPAPPIKDQIAYENFAAGIHAHQAAGTPADVESEGPDEIIPGVPVFHSTADLMVDIMRSLPPI